MAQTKKIVAIEQHDIYHYGVEWMRFMQEHHPKKIRQVRKDGIYLAVAKVDDSAWEYRELLDNQYAEYHPRPSGFEAAVSWETTRSFYTNVSTDYFLGNSEIRLSLAKSDLTEAEIEHLSAYKNLSSQRKY